MPKKKQSELSGKEYVLAPQPRVQRKADSSEGDYYPTPPWALLALLAVEGFQGTVWEPACGEGYLSLTLRSRGMKVHSSDLFDRGYGTAGVDFTSYGQYAARGEKLVDNLITNPPYLEDLPAQFMKIGHSITRNKVALLMRLAVLEGQDRYHDVYTKIPPSRVWIFSRRLTMIKNRVIHPGDKVPEGEKKKAGTVAYAWFIWDHNSPDTKRFDFIPPAVCNKVMSESRAITQLVESRRERRASLRIAA